jgi:hypothetical protein
MDTHDSTAPFRVFMALHGTISEAPQLLNFDSDANPEQAFHSDADPAPSPQNYSDPDPQHYLALTFPSVSVSIHRSMRERAHFVAISFSGSQSSTTALKDTNHSGALHNKLSH